MRDPFQLLPTPRSARGELEYLQRELRAWRERGVEPPKELVRQVAELAPLTQTARSVLGPAVASARSVLGEAAASARSVLGDATIDSLLSGLGYVAARREPKADDARIRSDQFRAEQPRRDADRREKIVRALRQRWGASIEDDQLMFTVSAVPARRLRRATECVATLRAVVKQFTQLSPGIAGDAGAPAASRPSSGQCPAAPTISQRGRNDAEKNEAPGSRKTWGLLLRA